MLTRPESEVKQGGRYESVAFQPVGLRSGLMNSPLLYLSISEAVNEVNILVGNFPVVVVDCEDSETDDSMTGWGTSCCMDAELFVFHAYRGGRAGRAHAHSQGQTNPSHLLDMTAGTLICWVWGNATPVQARSILA